MAETSEELANSEIEERIEEAIGEEIIVKERKVKFNESVAIAATPPPNLIPIISFSHVDDDHFQQWLNRQKEKDRIAAREKYIKKRVESIDTEAKQQQKERGRAAFEMWKQRKELEAIERNNLKREIEQIHGLLNKETKRAETLPGYISTWSSDAPLVRKMQKQCPRSKNF